MKQIYVGIMWQTAELGEVRSHIRESRIEAFYSAPSVHQLAEAQP